MSNPIDETHKILREKIVSGEFRPAQRLTENMLAQELGISRNYVRQAFQRLAFDGLIELLPNQGAVVADVILDDILDIFVAREALEIEAYRRAFVRMTDTDFGQLETLIQQMQEAIEGNNFELYSFSATNFRATILDIADSPHLKELADSLLLITSRVVLRKIMIPLRGKSSLSEHELILQALRGDQLEDLETAFRNHIEKLKADIVQYWDMIKP